MTTIEQLKAEHKRICDNARNIAVERGTQYATEEDTLQTFSRASYLIGSTSALLCMDLIGIKVSRLSQQIMTNPTGMMDSIFDIINYLVYLTLLYKEEN